MPSLFDLTPAEYYMLKAAPKAEFSKAVMITMKDLSLKDVIDIRVEEVAQRASTSRVRRQAFVHAFREFDSYRFRPHEKVFGQVLGNKGNRMMLINYLREVYQRTPVESRYGRQIASSRLNQYFRPINWSWSRLSASPNNKGKILRKSLSLELKNHMNLLKTALEEDPYEAYGLTQELNGFLYLVPPKDLDDIVFILSNQNQKILNSSVKDRIYAWFLEMEKIKEFDPYYYKAVKLVDAASQRSRWGDVDSV